MNTIQNNYLRDFPKILEEIAKAIHASGGRSLLVGGSVIDTIMNKPVKDWDIEVYHLSFQELEDTLAQFGDTNLVGKAFGIIKLSADDIEFDFSLPRLENRIGIGHKAFSVELKSDISPREAAIRRDLTINSMYVDLITGELIDPFGGADDLKEGIIRATNPETFIEDPLRVLRIMQLLPRKGKTVNKETIKLCRSMVDEFHALPKERLFEEFKKLLLKSANPSLGFKFLDDCGWLKHFPELNNLKSCPQHPEWHPEGDVWQHTLLAIDEAAKVRDKLEEDWQLPFMFGVLLHDTGKPAVTNPETFTAYGHDKVGIETALSFLDRITNDKKLIERVTSIVSLHMQPYGLSANNAKIGGWKRLHNKLRLDILGWHSYVDKRASTLQPESAVSEPSKMCFEYFEELGKDEIKPILQGRHLIAAGLTPGPVFRGILDYAFEYQMETGETDVERLLGIGLKKKKA